MVTLWGLSRFVATDPAESSLVAEHIRDSPTVSERISDPMVSKALQVGWSVELPTSLSRRGAWQA